MTTTEKTELTYRWAINHAIAEEMRRDPTVIFYGEDVGKHGGNFGVSRALQDEFGEQRVIDTPISEQAIIGTALGAALTGLRPVVEIMFAGFLCTCFDGIFMKLGTWQQRYHCSSLPVVVRAPMGAAGGAGSEHSFSPEALLIHSPGLKVAVPSTPYDAKGLLKTAIRGSDPVIYLEHILLYTRKGTVPSEEYLVPFGQADIKREGKDATIVTYSAMVFKALAAAEQLSQEGIEAEVVDLRTLVPLDEEAILNSVEKTGKLVIVHEAMERGGVAGEITAIVADKAFDYLDAPIKRVAALNVPLPHSAKLEAMCIPQEKNIVEAVKSLL
jgi:pyruvate/2-oxoglutarate/acetoin dehydrogenase E1 component